jgi:hypothetical protein
VCWVICTLATRLYLLLARVPVGRKEGVGSVVGVDREALRLIACMTFARSLTWIASQHVNDRDVVTHVDADLLVMSRELCFDDIATHSFNAPHSVPINQPTNHCQIVQLSLTHKLAVALHRVMLVITIMAVVNCGIHSCLAHLWINQSINGLYLYYLLGSGVNANRDTHAIMKSYQTTRVPPNRDQ